MLALDLGTRLQCLVWEPEYNAWSGNQTTILQEQCIIIFIQSYLKSVNDLWEEFVGHKVGVFAVCGQPKEEVDLMMSENNLKFKVGT